MNRPADRSNKKILSILLLISLIIFASCRYFQKPNDIIIKSAKIIDGTGNPWYSADIGIKDGRIARIGLLNIGDGDKIINAEGLIAAPGFIDVHTHADRDILSKPDALNYLRQGVTTLVGGNCGSSLFPLEELFERIEEKGIGINFASLSGHNTIRKTAMGEDDRKPAAHELLKMKSMVRQDMLAGALGLSTGLIYVPGGYSESQEIIELAKEIKPFEGIYVTHMRSEGKNIASAVQEALQIGSLAGVRVEISHVKLADETVWGNTELITGQVMKHRQQGLEVTMDQYPYTASSTGLINSFPGWAAAGGHDSLVKRLEDPVKYEKIKQAIIKIRLTSPRNRFMPDMIFIAANENHPEYEGKNLAGILELIGKENTVENATELIIEMEKEDQPSGVYFKMNENDVTALMQHECTMTASDGGIKTVNKGMPHPRSYGTFPRVLGRYVREKSVLSLEDAVRKMTSLPAQTMRFNARGILKEGMCADIVIFDEKKVLDQAAFDKPHQYPVGIPWVIVNGEPAIANGERTDTFSGEVIYGAGKID